MIPWKDRVDRRYFVALLVSLLILLIYPQYLKWIGGAPSQRTSYENATQQIPLSPTLEKREIAPASRTRFHNNQYGIVFTNAGGNVTLLTQADTVLYKSSPEETGIFGVRILHEPEDTSQVVFNDQTPQGKATGPQFVYEKAGEYRLVKRYFVGNDRPSFVLEIELENLSKKEKNFPLELDYGLELDLENRGDEPKVKIVR